MNASLLHLPIVEVFHSFEQLHVDDIVDMLVELLEARAETIQCHGSYVRLSWLRDMYQTKIEACCWINMSSGTYAWGATTLVHMYDNLNEASKSTTRQLAGYITLLQYWIYEHFLFVGSALAIEDYDKRRSLLTYRRRLDRLTPDVVCWIPYGGHRSFREFEVISLFSNHLRWVPLAVIYRPKRVVRQFRYIQTIPPHLTAPSTFVEEMDARWMQFNDYIAPLGKICVVHDQCSSDYMEWFYMILHPFMSPAQLGDPPRVSPQLVVAATPDEANVDVHHPQHAVDGYVVIVDKLERLLNLRILTKGTEVYTVVEKCLSITRSYIGQPTVDHRSRRKTPKRFDIPSGCSIDRLKDVIK
ncbi:Protein MAINTENANCE OF MERISTEMS [Glycine soja]